MPQSYDFSMHANSVSMEDKMGIQRRQGKWNGRALALCAAMVCISSLAMADQKDKTPPQINSNKRVAVGGFDPRRAVQNYDGAGLGGSAADMLTNELSNLGALMLERSQLAALEREGELGIMGITNASTAPQLGQKVGAEWMVVGDITEFGMKKTNVGIGFITSRIGLGDMGVGNTEARVKADVRIVDARTGIILVSATGEGKENKGSFSATYFEPWRFLGSINFSESEWTDSMLGKATRKAMKDAAWKLAAMWELAERKSKALPPAETQSAPSTSPAQQLPAADLGALRGLSVIVVIPESILQRPRVPDPAAETEMIRQLLLAGVKVVDDQRAKQLADDRAVMAMLRGQADPAKLQELRTMFSADILIVGEAIAERNDQQVAGLASVLSRARVEIRAIRMDTGEILAADAEQGPGRDLSEILAGKNALQNTSKILAPRFISMMASQVALRSLSPNSRSIPMQIEIGGWNSLGEAQAFLIDLQKVSGINAANRTDFRGGILFATVECPNWAADDLAIQLESAAILKKYRIAVQTASKAKIEAKIQGQ